MKSTPIYRLAPQLLVQFDLAEAVVLDESLGVYFAANPVASLILKTCRDGATREAAVAAIVAAFRVDTQRATADFDVFAADLAARGLLLQG
jgi:hypothetical protein